MKRAAGRRVDLDDIAILTHPAQPPADLTRVEVPPAPGWAEQLLGTRPKRGHSTQRLWDRASHGVYPFHTEFGAPSREALPLQHAPTDARELQVRRRAVERVAETRGVLSADGLPVVVDDLAAALGELGQFGRDG